MNIKESQLEEYGYRSFMERTQSYLTRVLGPCTMQLSTDTYQFHDYSKYLSTAWDPEAKARRKEEVFPQDCAKAAELGRQSWYGKQVTSRSVLFFTLLN